MNARARLSHHLASAAIGTPAEIDLGALLGPEWSDFSFRLVSGQGWNLFNPQWRSGFTAGELKAHFFHIMGVQRERLAAQRAIADAEAANQRADDADARAAWYRSQLCTESRLAGILAALPVIE